MPILKFQCTVCGLSQRKRVSRGTESISCTCGSTAFLNGSPNATVGFEANISNSLKVQDSGIESFDMDFDRVIGEDAQKKWEAIYQRRRDKWDIIHSNPGTDGFDLMKLPDGSYESIPTTAQVYRETRQDSMNKLNLQQSSSKE